MGSSSIVNTMLGWLKGVASWVLGLFDLAGTSGFSPLNWVSENWLALLVVLLTFGVVTDVVIWLVRWRPHWVWFNKKRIVINDDNFFAGEELVDSGLYDPELFANETPVRRRPAPRNYSGDRRGSRRGESRDDIFDVSRSANPYSGGEDDVFNISDLPVSKDELDFRRSQKRR